MVAEKILAIGLVASATGTLIAQVTSAWHWPTEQEAIVLSGIVTTCGLATINFYQQFRELRRKQNIADLEVTAASDRAKAAALESDLAKCKEELKNVTDEAKRWLKLYQATTQAEPTGPPDHTLAGETP